MSDAAHDAGRAGAVDGRPPEGGELIPVDLDGSLIWRAAVTHARPLGHEGTRDDQMADIRPAPATSSGSATPGSARAGRPVDERVLVLLEDQRRARGINLHILTGICAGL